MKIRIKGNSVRIRLSKSEVGVFAKEGYVEESTDFGDRKFKYAVKSSPGETLSAQFKEGSITLLVPEDFLQEWASGNLIGIDYNLPVNNDSTLYLLLEKDFKCIDAVAAEDQSDYFENPVKSC